MWGQKISQKLLGVRRNCWGDNVQASLRYRTACRYEATPGRLIIWRPLQLIFFKFFFGLGHGWQIFLGSMPIFQKIERNCFMCGNLRLLTTYF